jgi:hypothetical protein
MLFKLINYLLRPGIHSLGPLAIGGIVGGSALLGGLLGSQGRSSSQSNQGHSYMKLGQLNDFEKYLGNQQQSQFQSLENLFGQGPNQADFLNSVNLARGYIQNPFAGKDDLLQAGDYTNQLRAPEYASLYRSQRDQGLEANRLAARLGRSSADPTLQGMMRSKFLDQLDSLNQRQTGMTAQYADQGIQRRLGLSDALAQQASSNRQLLLNLGNQIYNQGRQFQVATADRFNLGNANSNTPGPGFLAGALQGASTGLGMLSMASMFGGGGDITSGSGIGSSGIGSAPSYHNNYQGIYSQGLRF